MKPLRRPLPSVLKYNNTSFVVELKLGGEENLEQLAEEFLSEQGDGRIDLEQAQYQHVRTVAAGEVQEFSDLREQRLILANGKQSTLTCRECPLSAR